MEINPIYKNGKGEGRAEYTPLNKWLMNLSVPARKMFYEKLLNNEALFHDKPRDRSIRKNHFNNWRYKKDGIDVTPNEYKILLVYTSAVYADTELDIKTIFPNVPENLVDMLLPSLLQSSMKSNNFKKHA